MPEKRTWGEFIWNPIVKVGTWIGDWICDPGEGTWRESIWKLLENGDKWIYPTWCRIWPSIGQLSVAYTLLGQLLNFISEGTPSWLMVFANKWPILISTALSYVWLSEEITRLKIKAGEIDPTKE